MENWCISVEKWCFPVEKYKLENLRRMPAALLDSIRKAGNITQSNS
ncbi:hypothetical protein HC766_08160 [Candidatus Gracilibacteria bacterium]|nr:hypothetical protein [Candidatus Gracilibacteria bacterium]